MDESVSLPERAVQVLAQRVAAEQVRSAYLEAQVAELSERLSAATSAAEGAARAEAGRGEGSL